jgi:protein-glutamine gamma-glutamyltransferase
MADFLLRTRAGHCEYFATATVLLLRAAGVPARYATGFSAQEYSRLEEAYIVRVRHAHAWTKAWIGGRWVDMDTTPPSWVTVEAAEASWLSPAGDLWAWLRFRLSQLGGSRDEDRTAATVIVVALMIALWFGWRLYQQRRLMVFGGPRGPSGRAAPAPGADSEFYRIERELAQSGLGREPGETVMAWIARIESVLPPARRADNLQEIAALHYRYRFDPAGLPAREREQLRTLALAWLARPGTTG